MKDWSKHDIRNFRVELAREILLKNANMQHDPIYLVKQSLETVDRMIKALGGEVSDAPEDLPD